MRLGAVVLLGAATLLVSGCAAAQDEPVSDASGEFYEALAEGDAAAACRLLAPATRSELEQSSGRPCEAAIGEEGLPTVGEPVDVAVFGTSGRVRFDGETAFLSRFGDDWRVTAAGCTARGDDRPLDCRLSGG